MIPTYPYQQRFGHPSDVHDLRMPVGLLSYVQAGHGQAEGANATDEVQ